MASTFFWFARLSLCALILCPCYVVMKNNYVSTASLSILAEFQDHVFDILENYEQQNQKELNKIREMKDTILRRVKRMKKAATKWHPDSLGFVEHPIGALNLITNWLMISRKIESKYLSTSGMVNLIPERDDYVGAIEGLVRLQFTYQLDTRQMAAGVVGNISAGLGMSPTDCYEMGKAWMSRDHSLAMSWFDAVKKNRKASDGLKYDAGKYVNIIEKTCGELKSQRNTNPTDTLYWKEERNPMLHDYEILCRGENISNTIFNNKDLICTYKEGILPYIRYKEEIHSLDPRISLFHDVISDANAEMVKLKALGQLGAAKIKGTKTFSKSRISKVAWLRDDEEDIQKVSRQVSAIAGLATQYRPQGESDAEDLQVVNYGIGGQYVPHHDYLGYSLTRGGSEVPKHIRGSGDRIATFMFYKAAVFWYNYQRSNDEGDDRTLHAGCPVLLGQKWVANKWILQHGQVFTRPCGLRHNDTDPVFGTQPVL